MIVMHLAGPMKDGIQRCMRCGETLIDRNEEMGLESDMPLPADRGWPQGPVSIQKSGPPVTQTWPGATPGALKCQPLTT